MKKFAFKIIKKDKKSRARLGILKTPHGIIETPSFAPVATKGALRGINFDIARKYGAEIFMINTFHFFHNKRYKIVKKFGGLHKFLNIDYPLMTDSGGFQVFSLGFGSEHGVGKIASIFPEEMKNKGLENEEFKNPRKNFIKICEDKIVFNSPYSGEKMVLTPELSIEIQKNLGADIVFAFDECTSPLAGYEYTKKSLTRTHNWALRSLKEFQNQEQIMFGIVQGGEYKDLRQSSAKFIGSLPFFGFGIGGSLGKSKKDMQHVLNWTIPILPEWKPRHLLGIGEPEDLLEAIARGIDLFDCVMPTRLARHSAALTSRGRINISSPKYLQSKNQIDKNCTCYVCKNHSLGYVSHLIKEKEIFGIMLLTEHNLAWILDLMRKIRESIRRDEFLSFKKKFLYGLK